MVRNHHSVTILNVITIIVAYCAINSLLSCYPIIYMSLCTQQQQQHHHHNSNHDHHNNNHNVVKWPQWLAVAEAANANTAQNNPTTSIINAPNSAFIYQQQQQQQNNITSLLTLATANVGQPLVKSRYLTQLACEDRQLQIECDEGTRINLIRANFGRFSIAICNEQGQLDWSIDCMSPISFRIMQDRCDRHRSCAVNASSTIFGDKCPKTRKYLEVHYQCQEIPQLTQQQPTSNNNNNNYNLTQDQMMPSPPVQNIDQNQQPINNADLWTKPDPTVNQPNQGIIKPSPIPNYLHPDIYQPVSTSNNQPLNTDYQPDRTITSNNNPSTTRDNNKFNFNFPISNSKSQVSQLQQPSLPDSDQVSEQLSLSPQYLEELYSNVIRLPIIAPMDPSTFNGSEPPPYSYDATTSNNNRHQATGPVTFFNSEVMSLPMIGLKDKPLVLATPEQITMRHHSPVQGNISNPRCVLWDQQSKVWTTRGCALIETNTTHTSCACDRITVYVVVVDASADQQRNVTFINSDLTSLSMIDRPIILSEPVSMTMRHLQQDNVTNPRCVSWDQMRKDWTGQGCKHIETNTTHTSCSCDHFAYYAVLMDLSIPNSMTVPMPYLSHDPLWRTITFCSFIIASVCLSITLITLVFMVRQQRRLANQRKQQRNNNYYYGASSYYQQQQKLSSASTSNNNTIYAPQQRVDSHTISKQQEQSDYGQHQQKNMQQKTSYTVINNYNNTSTSLVDDFMSSIPAINNTNASVFDNSACLINGNNNVNSPTVHEQLHKNTNSEIGMIIYKNLCLTVLVVEFLYLVTVNHYNHHKLYCHVVSRLMHFALMATFMWCLIEAHELHKNLKSFLKSTTAVNNHYKHSHHHHRTNQQANKLTSLLSNHQQQASSPNPCLVVSGNQSHDISLMQHMLQLQQQQTDSSSVGSPTSQDTNATITATLPPLINNTTAGPIPLIRNVINCNSPTSDIQQSNAYWMNKNDVDHYDHLEVSSWTTRRSRYMHLIAYAVPCLVVCITSFVTPQVYFYGPFSQQPLVINHCWLAASSFGAATVFSGQKLMSLAMAPLLLLLVATATYLVICVYYINKYNRHMNGYVGNGGGNLTSGLITTNHMTLTLKKQSDRKKFNHMSVWLKKTILLVLLIALTWTLALPYLIDSNNISVIQQYSFNNNGMVQQQLLGAGSTFGSQLSPGKLPNYNQQRSAIIIAISTLIFAVANALIGIFIFTTQCLQSNQVRHYYKLVFQRFSLIRFFMRLSLAPNNSSPAAKYPSNNGTANVHLSGAASSNQSSYSSGSLSGIGRHPMTNQHTLASMRNSMLSHQQHNMANAFSSGQQQQKIAASAAYLNNQISDAPLDGQNNLIDGGAQSCQLTPMESHNNATLSYNPTQVTVGMSNGNKLLFQQQQQQIYGLHQANSNNNHYQMNQNSSTVTPMLNAAQSISSSATTNNGQDQQQKGYHITDEQSLTSSSDYGCRRLAGQGISQQQMEANNGPSGGAVTNDLSLLLSTAGSHQCGDALSQLLMSHPNAYQSEVQKIVQQFLIMQKHQQPRSTASSRGLIQEHIYECIDDDNPYIAKLLLPTLYSQLSPDQKARHIATIARQIGLNTTSAVSPSSSSSQTMGGRASQQNHHQQQMQMNQLALASRLLKSPVQQSTNGQSVHQQQQQTPCGQQRHFALPAIVRDNQKTSVICSKSTQQTTIGPQVATAINCNSINGNNQLQQAHDIMAIYDSSSTGGMSSLNVNAPFSYGRSDKLSTDC